ncbi:MAG TPA: hypothetical protein VN578_07330 [Candidatus Binatia bacterium]|jgi:hypothetical protein|nr:hypothetical protein [Candidatus Binatia bacterium]
MSSRISLDCRFEPANEQTIGVNLRPPEGIAAESQFREDLWREYRREALNAGFNPAQATEYAGALSPDMGLVGGLSGTGLVGRGWFYKSRSRVVRRTVTSGLISLRRW